MARRALAPGSWQRIVDPALAPYVLARSASRKHSYRWWLMALGGVLAIVSLAGPSWNRAEQPVFRSEQAMVIALDLSRSMDAQDLTPSRLTRARLKILDILERRKSGQTALVVYSSNAFTVTPLTTDADTVAALVNSLSTDIMPSRGSYPVAAINKGRQLLEQAGVGYGEVLLITDGGTSPAAERAARELTSAGYTLSVMGVGTLQGAPIPIAGGGFVTDGRGQLAVPKLESRELQKLASEGGGRFTQLSADDRDLEVLLSGVIDASSSSATDESLATDQWLEEGPWLLILLLPLAALPFRRGWLFVVCLGILPFAEPVYAFSWDDLWMNRDQQGQKQLGEGNATEAAALFEDPVWRAVANYRAGEYTGSAEGFAGQDDTDNLYNLGNALARMGEFASAIDAYERVLEAEPDNDDAAYNLELLQQLQDQQQNQSGEGQNQDSSSQSGGEGQQGEGDQNQSGAEGEAGNSGSESDGDTGSQEEMSQEDLEAIQAELERAAQEAQQQQGQMEESEGTGETEAFAERRAQEQRQAMEQWLRRIPNDPGGLLRRKFRYQYQRMGRDQDGNNLWPDDEAQPW
jgi:Ca-activated chloride channel family protein